MEKDFYFEVAKSQLQTQSRIRSQPQRCLWGIQTRHGRGQLITTGGGWGAGPLCHWQRGGVGGSHVWAPWRTGTGFDWPSGILGLFPVGWWVCGPTKFIIGEAPPSWSAIFIARQRLLWEPPSDLANGLGPIFNLGPALDEDEDVSFACRVRRLESQETWLTVTRMNLHRETVSPKRTSGNEQKVTDRDT